MYLPYCGYTIFLSIIVQSLLYLFQWIGGLNLAVELEIDEANVGDESGDGVAVGGDAIEGAILYFDVVDIAYVIEAFHLHTEFAFLACHVLKEYVAHCRGEVALAYLTFLIHEIDLEYGFLASAYLDVSHEDVFDESAAAVVGLDAYHALKFG